jgi:hypothetical protein
MKLITDQITLSELESMAESRFGDFVKAVVDVDKQIMVVDADLHADQEAMLLQQGSQQQNLWGVNLYPGLPKTDWIEFDSMINLRPSQNNQSRGVEDETIQKQIVEVITQLVQR